MYILQSVVRRPDNAWPVCAPASGQLLQAVATIPLPVMHDLHNAHTTKTLHNHNPLAPAYLRRKILHKSSPEKIPCICITTRDLAPSQNLRSAFAPKMQYTLGGERCARTEQRALTSSVREPINL
jgi:hypothetical protein